MIGRRDLLVGVACLAAAGSAEALIPRRQLSLLGKSKMEKIVPVRVGSWTSEVTDGLVKPKTEGKLAASLYSEMVGRDYRDDVSGMTIMMLIAYGDTQSDLLQLHRPENCYPALGFTLRSTARADIKLAGGGLLPVRHVVADAGERHENITYWTRMGEYLPASQGEQRADRLKNAMAGVVPDGVLVRFSMLGEEPAQAFATMDAFIANLVAAVPAANRKALVGTDLAKRMMA